MYVVLLRSYLSTLSNLQVFVRLLTRLRPLPFPIFFPLSLPYYKVPRPSADGSPVPGLLRIFIEYQDVAAATAAATELNGKPFAGQTVQVR